MISLSGAFLGVDMLYNPNPIPETSTYNKLTLYGEGIFDKVWIRNRIETDAYISNLTVDNYIAEWDVDTVFLADFEELNLNAGNIKNLTSPITSFEINKRNINSNIYTNIGEITNNDEDSFSIVDYLVRVGESYEYQILPKTANEIAEALISAPITSDYYGWFLIDEVNNISYKFDINLASSPMSAEYDQTEYQTYLKHNVYSQGKRDFKKGSITAIIPEIIDVNCQFTQSSDFMDTLETFVNNGEIKLLKSRKGDVFRVVTNGFVRAQWDDAIQEQIDVVTINFSEVENINNI